MSKWSETALRSQKSRFVKIFDGETIRMRVVVEPADILLPFRGADGEDQYGVTMVVADEHGNERTWTASGGVLRQLCRVFPNGLTEGQELEVSRQGIGKDTTWFVRVIK